MIDVVAAIIKNNENKILIAQRNFKKSQGGLWEFPGGKIEKGETREEALIREIKEELNMDIICDSYFGEKKYNYPDKTIRLIALNCTMISKSYEVLEHEQIEWVDIEDFSKYVFAAADIYFADKLLRVKS